MKTIFDAKNVLVTGGAGFIGSHLCDELVRNSKVICVDDFSTGDEKNIDHLLSNPNFEFIRHDINKPLDLEKMPELQKFKIEFQGIQEVYNLACPTAPNVFDENKIHTLLSNSVGIKNVLDFAVKYEAKFLQFSSSVVYGPRRDDNPRISENDIGDVDFLSVRSAYDEGKRYAETMVKNYREVYQLEAKIIRLFRVYGPRMKLDVGHMIPDFVSNALDNKPLEIMGDEDFLTSLCYVSDVIDAATKIMDSKVYGPINIGSDVDIKIIDVAKKILDLTNSHSEINFIEEHFFMTSLCLPNITKAKEELGWLPVVTLNKGLESTIHDLRANKGLKSVKNAI